MKCVLEKVTDILGKLYGNPCLGGAIILLGIFLSPGCIISFLFFTVFMVLYTFDVWIGCCSHKKVLDGYERIFVTCFMLFTIFFWWQNFTDYIDDNTIHVVINWQPWICLCKGCSIVVSDECWVENSSTMFGNVIPYMMLMITSVWVLAVNSYFFTCWSGHKWGLIRSLASGIPESVVRFGFRGKSTIIDAISGLGTMVPIFSWLTFKVGFYLNILYEENFVFK